ncbi:hypothetical protein LHYA1_G000641 [Lachnellula hyalina]|uniref:Uncharacterized protein n=1 Tax=Lachnellula hyalina TaxID=1316788 RepID=A0A8H8R9T1_9HELO|nr:uncharacterized protein LHYA1_G000641 [Lachnellula hyalina]TVY30603.1 hypothetical protein LHYA1_G000641 [Lachnellula hyalina]
MSRPVYLIIYHSPIFAAHWALWIPYYEQEVAGNSGKIINVQGSPSEGFLHEFERNYDIAAETRRHSIRLLSWLDSKYIIDTTGDYSVDSTAIDFLECSALTIQAPGPSLRSAGEHTWLRQFVSILVENGTFSEDALVELDNAPKN